MPHEGFKGSVVEEVDDPDTQGQAIEQPPIEQVQQPYLDWSKVEKDPRYLKAAPQQQESVRQKYWDSYLTKDPRISSLAPEKQQSIMEKFIRPPVPEGTVKKAVKGVASFVQKGRELDPGSETLNYFITEGVGGTLAAGAGGVAAVFQGLVKGDPSIMPEVYTTTRDALRQFLVAEPTTEAGKKSVEKIAPVVSWPIEKVDQGIKAVEDKLFEKMEPRYGTDQAAAISLAIGEGLRGTLIYATLGVGGKFGGVGSLERKAGIPEVKGPGQLEGPPGRLQLEGPDIFNMPGEVRQFIEGPPKPSGLLEGPNLFERPDERYRRGGESSVIQQTGPTSPKLLEGPVREGGGPSLTPKPIAPPEAIVKGIESDIFEGEYRIVTPEPTTKPSVLGMSIEELRIALLTDEMTGLPNRRAYEEAPKKPVQVLNDVDGLKYINDNFGHEAGDALIKTVAQVAREEGLEVYRAGQGADEFVTQFNSTGEAYSALGRLQKRLGNAIIEAEKPDGTKVRLKGLAFSYGVGRNLTEADKQLGANKLTREQTGLRAERGGRPPGLEEISVEATKRDKVSGPSAKVTPTENAPTSQPSAALVPRQESSSPVGVGGGPSSILTPEPPLPIPDATLRETRKDMIRKAAERYRAKKKGLPVPKDEPIVEIRPKAKVTETGLSPRLARPEKGLPIVRITEAEFEAELRRSKLSGGTSIEETGLGGSIRLYSGIPLDEAVALARLAVKKIRSQVGTKFRVGQDLSPLQVMLEAIVTPSFLSKVDPIAADFIATNQALRHGVYYKTAVDFNAKIDKIVKDLTPREKELVGQLLDSYHDLREIPLDLLNARKDITPKVLDAFTSFRERIFEPLWRDVTATSPPQKTAGKVHEYFTRVYEDFLQESGKDKNRYDAMIRTFAEENGLDYADAYRIFHKEVPGSGFFGPVSRSRTAEAQTAGRIWDVEKVARMYVAGVSRKMYLDQMLPLANKALNEIRHPQINKVVRDYVDRQRGIPDSALKSVLQANPLVAKIARFEALRQYTSKLGLRPVLTLINATQYPLLDGTKAISRALFEEKSVGPMHSFVKGALDVFTERGRAIVDRSGVRLGPTGWTPDPRSIRSGMEKIAHYAGYMHRMVDEYSRAASYLRNYYDAQRLIEGKKFNFLSEEEWMAKNLYAMKGVAETQFFYDVSGAPAMYSNPLVANLGRFKQYTINMAGLVANLPAREIAVFVAMLDLAGGPDAIPGIRQMYAQLRRRHPDALVTKVLNGLQEWSVAGVTGLDIGEQVGFGFIPGASTDEATFQNFKSDFWATVGRQIQGPTAADVQSLYKDIDSGVFDLSDPDWVDILGSKSAGGISVTMQKAVRGVKEWDNRYVEWSRGRKGVELDKKDVIARALGIDTTAIARRQQEFAAWNDEVDEAISEKEKIEDLYVESVKKGRMEKVEEVTSKMAEFNQRYGVALGVWMDYKSLRSAYVNSLLTPEMRVGRSNLQKSLLKGRLDPYAPQPLPTEGGGR